jgi:hypothetical protein
MLQKRARRACPDRVQDVVARIRTGRQSQQQQSSHDALLDALILGTHCGDDLQRDARFIEADVAPVLKEFLPCTVCCFKFWLRLHKRCSCSPTGSPRTSGEHPQLSCMLATLTVPSPAVLRSQRASCLIFICLRKPCANMMTLSSALTHSELQVRTSLTAGMADAVSESHESTAEAHALLMPNLVTMPINAGHGPVVTFDIKPKAGTVATDLGVHPKKRIKHSVSRYRLHQMLKAHEVRKRSACFTHMDVAVVKLIDVHWPSVSMTILLPCLCSSSAQQSPLYRATW